MPFPWVTVEESSHREAIAKEAYYADETTCIQHLLVPAALPDQVTANIAQRASQSSNLRMKGQGLVSADFIETARVLDQDFVNREGEIVPFIAETGGQNAMIKNREQAIQSINHTSHGLTLGIQSRVQRTVDTSTQQVHVGNQYINRSVTDTVVGVQPFGGEGLSGTGPKAGGPHGLPRLCLAMVLGGNASLLCLEE